MTSSKAVSVFCMSMVIILYNPELPFLESSQMSKFVRWFSARHMTVLYSHAFPSLYNVSVLIHLPCPHIISKHLNNHPLDSPLAAKLLKFGFQLLLFGSEFVPSGFQFVALTLQSVDVVTCLLQDHYFGCLIIV